MEEKGVNAFCAKHVDFPLLPLMVVWLVFFFDRITTHGVRLFLCYFDIPKKRGILFWSAAIWINPRFH